MPLELNQILEIGVRGGASDIHLKAGFILDPVFKFPFALISSSKAGNISVQGR